MENLFRTGLERRPKGGLVTTPSRPISDAELDVLKALWTLEQATVRDLQAYLQKQGREWAYTTVQTLLQRLEEKSYVKCDRAGRAHVFRARVTRDAHVGARLEELVDRVCDGTASPLVISLVERGHFSKDEIDRFRQLLDDIEASEQDPTRRAGKTGRRRRRKS